jgi:hypothetical protein
VPTHSFLGSGTCIQNLAFCCPRLSVHFKWFILSNLHGSDLYPANIHITTSHLEEFHHANWITKEANWESHWLYSLMTMCSWMLTLWLNVSQIWSFKLLGLLYRSCTRPCHVPVPLWIDKCCSAIHARKLALRYFQIHPTHENLTQFKCLCTRVQHAFSSETYLSPLSWTTVMVAIWKKKKCQMFHKCRNILIPGGSVNSATITSQTDIANSLASSFAFICRVPTVMTLHSNN